LQHQETGTPKASFERAMTFLRAGDSAMAETICRRALNDFPRDANLLCLLGASLLRQGKPKDAEHTLTRAVRLYGRFARAHETLAEALMMQGRLPEALEALERAEELEPGSASVRLKKGKVLDGLGREDDASRAFEESFKLTPHREELVRGLRLQRMGDLVGAERVYRDVIIRDPENVDALRLLAGVAMRAKQWSDAEALLEKALDIAPDFVQGWMDLGLARQEQDRTDDALAAYARAERLEPENPNAYAAAATTNAMAGRHDEALLLFDRAIGKDARHAAAHSGRGHVLKTIGRQEDAVQAYRHCTEHNPWHGETWWSLANLKTFHFEPQDIEVMERQLENGNLGDEQRANFQFALGKAYEDAGEYSRAFEYYRAGNDNRRQRETYDPVNTADSHDKFIEVFTRSFVDEKAGHGNPSNAPIFIVGLPRSGSTLLEQILASHPDVEGTHELPDLGRVARSVGTQRQDRKGFPAAVWELDDEDFDKLGADYLRRTARHRVLGTPRFTDKMPNNFAHVGLLSLILPNAKIIDARRHPLDSCLGSYKQLFARGQPFTYDLFELGEFYLEYRRLMDHWHDVLPGKVLEVQYESVVDDLEGEVRRILDYCEVPWNDACLRFYETDRAVKTASSEQVRKPIYESSKHHWRKYEEELAPLIEILEPILRELPEDWRPKSIIE
jgi:tetratricopeptide (TPR) repeat protein